MAEKRLKRPRDPVQLAKLIGDIATGQVEDKVEDAKNPAAVELGRLGGKKGGAARAKAIHIDMDFGEALERFGTTDPDELPLNVKLRRSKKREAAEPPPREPTASRADEQPSGAGAAGAHGRARSSRAGSGNKRQ